MDKHFKQKKPKNTNLKQRVRLDYLADQDIALVYVIKLLTYLLTPKLKV